MASDVQIEDSLKIPLLVHSNKLLKYACSDKDKKAVFSDVALLNGEKIFYAHRLVLAAYSPHFSNLLSKYCTNKSGSMASQSLMLKVDFVKEIVLVRLLDFMYRGYLEVHGVDLQQLLTGAQMLRIDSAISIIQKLIQLKPTMCVEDISIKQEVEEEDGEADVAEEDESEELVVLSPTAGTSSGQRQTSAVLSVEPNISLANVDDPDSVVIRYLAVAARVMKYMNRETEGENEGKLSCSLCGLLLENRNRPVVAARYHLSKLHRAEVLLGIAEDTDFDAGDQGYIPPKGKIPEVLAEDEGALQKLPKRKKSAIWNFFELSDKEGDEGKKLAKCILCNMLVSRRRGNTSSMRDHMRRKHTNVDPDSFLTPAIPERFRRRRKRASEQDEEDGEHSPSKARKVRKHSRAELLNAFFTFMTHNDEGDTVAIFEPAVGHTFPKPLKRSVVWKYFLKDPEDKTRAICKVCDKKENLNGGSTGSLRTHLKTQHKDLIIQENRELCEEALHKHRTSWSKFPRTKKETDETAASEELFEDSSWAVRTKKALLRSFFDGSASKDTTSEPAVQSKRSAVWKYFTELSEDTHDGKKKVKCTLCEKELLIWGSSTTSMKVHLEKQHAETIIIEQQESLGLRLEAVEDSDGEQPDAELASLKQDMQAEALILAWLDTPYSEVDENSGETVERLRVWKYFDIVEENKYKCNQCDIQYECLSGVSLINLIILLRKHLMESHKENAKEDLTGVDCELHMKAASHLVRFKDDMPTEEELGDKYWQEDEFVCDHCDLRTQSTVIMMCHVMSFKEGYLACPVCSLGGKNEKLMKDHVRKHHKDFCWISCLAERCNALFIDNRSMQDHYNQRHGGHIVYKCTVKNCNFVTNYKRDLNQHVGTEHKMLRHVCQFCGKIMSSKHGLRSHLKNLHNDQTLQCADCGFSTTQKYQFRTHMRNVHQKNVDGSSAEPYRCDKCATYTTFHKNLLLAHVKNVHENEKNHKCPHEGCDFRTATKYNVTLHYRTVHMNEFRLQCPHCTYKSVRRCHLNSHIKRTHGEKTLMCKFCENKYGDMRSLRLHMAQVHKDFAAMYNIMYECHICGFQNVRRFRVVDHVQKHHGADERETFEAKNPRRDPFTSRRMRSIPYTTLTGEGAVTVDPTMLDRSEGEPITTAQTVTTTSIVQDTSNISMDTSAGTDAGVLPEGVNYFVAPNTLTDYTVLVLPEGSTLPAPVPQSHGFFVEPGVIHVTNTAVSKPSDMLPKWAPSGQ